MSELVFIPTLVSSLMRESVLRYLRVIFSFSVFFSMFVELLFDRLVVYFLMRCPVFGRHTEPKAMRCTTLVHEKRYAMANGVISIS